MLPHTLDSLWYQCEVLGLLKSSPFSPLPPSRVTASHSQGSARLILKAAMLVVVMLTWTV